MKVLARFKKPDGSLTPTMTAEEINQGKAAEYGVTREQINQMFWKAGKYLVKAETGVDLEN